ncbi:MAG: Maf family nucleotide pyrophosphatase [Rhodospirillales bacterium]
MDPSPSARSQDACPQDAHPNAPHSSLPLVLASASPRRRALLAQIGLTPDRIDPPQIDEQPGRRELPPAYVRRMAEEKLAAAAPRNPDCWLLAADTVVTLGRRILPKAESEAEAAACLALLSGRRHRVLGAIAVLTPDGRRATRQVTTRVAMKRLSREETAAYLASGEWSGKAGGYAIQGRAGAFVPWIEGSYSNVVGLCLAQTHSLLLGLGYRPDSDA